MYYTATVPALWQVHGHCCTLSVPSVCLLSWAVGHNYISQGGLGLGAANQCAANHLQPACFLAMAVEFLVCRLLAAVLCFKLISSGIVDDKIFGQESVCEGESGQWDSLLSPSHLAPQA